MHIKAFLSNCCTIDEGPLDSYVDVMAPSLINRKFRYTYSNVTLKLIIINVLVFFLMQLNQGMYGYVALVPRLVFHRYWFWQLFTYMFVHANFNHILFNMLGLFIFGTPVERQLGSREFLLFYLLIGFLSGLFSFIVYVFSATNVILMGASGAIYAVLFAFAVLYPHARIFVFGILPIRAPLLVGIYTLMEVFNQLTGSGGGVAHLTHLAGFGFAYLYFIIRLRIHPFDQFRRGF